MAQEVVSQQMDTGKMQEYNAWVVSQDTDSSKNTKTRPVPQNIDISKNTAAWAVTITHWLQQEYKDTGCVTYTDISNNTKTRAVLPTLTSVTTARLGLCHLHWHQ